MIGFVTIGTSDFDRAVAFYDDLLGLIGIGQLMKTERMKMYGTVKDGGTLAVLIPQNKEPQRPGNGNMVAILADTKENIDKLYSRAIELGGSDEGGPGERVPTFYGAYVRDLDGNKLCFYCRF